MIGIETVKGILRDPQRTQDVVVAALKALETLQGADSFGRTPDGDGAIMTARTTLESAVADLRPVIEAYHGPQPGAPPITGVT